MLICDSCYTNHISYIDDILEDVTSDKPSLNIEYWDDGKGCEAGHYTSPEKCDMCDEYEDKVGEISFKVNEKMILRLVGRLIILKDKVIKLEKKFDEIKN